MSSKKIGRKSRGKIEKHKVKLQKNVPNTQYVWQSL